MTCKKCGAQLQPNQKFCQRCGTPVTVAPAQNARTAGGYTQAGQQPMGTAPQGGSAPRAGGPTYQEPVNRGRGQYEQGYYPPPPPPKRKTFNTATIIALISVVVTAAGMFLPLATSRFASAANSFLGGAAKVDESISYIELMNEEEELVALIIIPFVCLGLIALFHLIGHRKIGMIGIIGLVFCVAMSFYAISETGDAQFAIGFFLMLLGTLGTIVATFIPIPKN